MAEAPAQPADRIERPFGRLPSPRGRPAILREHGDVSGECAWCADRANRPGRASAETSHAESRYGRKPGVPGGLSEESTDWASEDSRRVYAGHAGFLAHCVSPGRLEVCRLARLFECNFRG